MRHLSFALLVPIAVFLIGCDNSPIQKPQQVGSTETLESDTKAPLTGWQGTLEINELVGLDQGEPGIEGPPFAQVTGAVEFVMTPSPWQDGSKTSIALDVDASMNPMDPQLTEEAYASQSEDHVTLGQSPVYLVKAYEPASGDGSITLFIRFMLTGNGCTIHSVWITGSPSPST